MVPSVYPSFGTKFLRIQGGIYNTQQSIEIEQIPVHEWLIFRGYMHGKYTHGCEI